MARTTASEDLTVQEAAVRAGVHPQTIRNWIKQGKLPCRRYGPSGWLISIDKKDLDAVRHQG